MSLNYHHLLNLCYTFKRVSRFFRYVRNHEFGSYDGYFLCSMVSFDAPDDKNNHLDYDNLIVSLRNSSSNTSNDSIGQQKYQSERLDSRFQKDLETGP